MRKLLLAGAIALVLAFVVSVGFAVRASNQDTDLDEQERVVAVNAVRLLNTALLDFKVHNRHYSSFDGLISSGSFQKTVDRLSTSSFIRIDPSRYNLLSEEDFLPGWKLSMVVAPDGAAYKLSLIRVGDRCRFGFFTDQGGIIHNGKAIDCPVY